jgi:hypothetical protein
MTTKEAGAVDRVEAEPVQRRCVADVMQERGGQQVGCVDAARKKFL